MSERILIFTSRSTRFIRPELGHFCVSMQRCCLCDSQKSLSSFSWDHTETSRPLSSRPCKNNRDSKAFICFGGTTDFRMFNASFVMLGSWATSSSESGSPSCESTPADKSLTASCSAVFGCPYPLPVAASKRMGTVSSPKVVTTSSGTFFPCLSSLQQTLKPPAVQSVVPITARPAATRLRVGTGDGDGEVATARGRASSDSDGPPLHTKAL
mmetsp:Transcript_30329/g.100641  ORF Transcript_30329/g.100641 Transcript_30329/m.100641 type:complete len:212 (+) Transcript_30329:2276-2911(+)